jgi:FAD/FMN-containing dehydrogenase
MNGTNSSQSILRPADLGDLAHSLAEAHRHRDRIEAVNLASLNQLVEHVPEDMTATVEAGMPLRDFQLQVAIRRQWLPIDPAHADRLTIGQLLSFDASGPRRYGHGTIRDSLIGIRVVLADGRIIKAGGKVVKNVAGYDLCKLFVGHRDTLGVIVEATFKLKPMPEAEALVHRSLSSLSEVGALLDQVVESELNPVILDLHNVSPANGASSIDRSMFHLVLGFAGAIEDVQYQTERAAALGINTPGSLDYEDRFWSADTATKTHKLSMLPSDLIKAISNLGAVKFVARAGNGIVYYRGGSALNRPTSDTKL